ncbi:selenoprotein domain protein [Beauveria brongniartii RCEF 3172]|uniref:Selenoprotein domain protein n=1 Tax=Beauveria brongniartii RCEF 3172 TaxID=1081107 RepID=A0A167HTC8_9HYPO|nr:selenoprotein domain protein [Beauveria brongniartii RCEF 3172]
MADKEYVTPAEAGGQRLPRVTIEFCTQCKWLLRAAYYAQELLSTFSTSLGEVALQPSTGGTFIVTIHHASEETTSLSGGGGEGASRRVLWDRKVDGGFPETKELKRRVRDVMEPGRDLGHVDRDYARPAPVAEKIKVEEVNKTENGGQNVTGKQDNGQNASSKECEDCK